MANEYICKQNAVDALDRIFDNVPMELTTEILRLRRELRGLSPADVAPVRHGHWTLVGWHKGMKVVECSCCKKRAIGATDFCPNCGAKMDAQGEE